MVTADREILRTCACCPNQCRVGLSPSAPSQAESLTPSGLSLIALAVLGGQLASGPDTLAALGRTGPARACVPLCPYGFDVPAAIDRLVENLRGGTPARARSG